MGLIPEAECWRPSGPLNILLETEGERTLVEADLATRGGCGGGIVLGNTFYASNTESRDAMTKKLEEASGAATATDYTPSRSVDRDNGF